MQRRILFVCAVLWALGLATAGISQQPMKHEPGRALISIYKVSPGKHVEFIRWMAAQEAAAREAGGMPAHWFMHTDGADWDFVVINHLGSEKEEAERSAKIADAMTKKGRPTGMAASLEFRQMIGSHTDTFSVGPYTAEDLLREMQKK